MVSFLAGLLEGLGLSVHSCIVWDKVNPSFSTYYHHSHEFIICASKNYKPAKGTYLGKDMVKIKKINPKSKQHPFDKPPELIKELCKEFPKGRVIDPFCGTGGLLVGAQKLGWEVVGVDISKEFCDIAKKRLKGDVIDAF